MQISAHCSLLAQGLDSDLCDSDGPEMEECGPDGMGDDHEAPAKDCIVSARISDGVSAQSA